MTSKQQPPEVEEISVLDLSERIYQGDGVAIYLTTRPLESSDDLLFASVDASFGGGALPVQVSQQSGIPLPEHPPEGGGYTLIPDESGTQSLALIQTVAAGKAPADNLAENLRAFADAHGIDVESIWVPFMGTGAGGLTYQDSGSIICTQLLQARAAQPASMPLIINLALPRNTAEDEFPWLAAYLKGFLTEVFPTASEAPDTPETTNLLARAFSARLPKENGDIQFVFTEILPPEHEDIIVTTPRLLELDPFIQQIFKQSFDQAPLTRPNLDFTILSSEPGANAQAFFNFSGPSTLGQAEHLSALASVIEDKDVFERSPLSSAKDISVFVPTQIDPNGLRDEAFVTFMNRIQQNPHFDRGSWETKFVFSFDEPLSHAEYTNLRETIKRTIVDLGGTYHPPAGGTANAPNEMPAQFHSDHALTDPKDDQLGRDAIAGAIATNVGRVWQDQIDASRPFAVHLSGRWGSGKSSILTFLRAKLEADTQFHKAPTGTIYKIKKTGWVVIDYNAWQMQEAGPAWWSLLTAVREQGYAVLDGHGAWPRLKDFAWRNFQIGWAWLVALCVIFFALLTYLLIGENTSVTELLEAENAWKFVAAIFTTLGTLGGFAKLVQGWSKSATETAEAMRDLQSDPTATVKARYEKIIATIDRPVAVFIDDLDRCEAQFVVDLLQSLQTAYARVPVLYVVAADRNWIVSAYNQVYKDFTPEISKPGAPLGYLFVKKIFQLSVPVPDLVPGDSTKLAEALLQTETLPEPQTKTKPQREQAIVEAAAEGDVEEVTRIVNEGASEGQDLGAKAIEAVTNPDNQQKLRHELLEYAHLFDANPRAIKRLINALTFRQGFAASSGAYPGFDVMARWTILSLRYPYSADLLCETPARISEVFAGPPGKDEVEFPNRVEASQILEGLTKDDIEKVAAFG